MIPPKPIDPQPNRETRSDLRILLWGIAALTGLHVATGLLPGINTWGVDYWSMLPGWGWALLLALAALSYVRPLATAVDSAAAKIRANMFTGTAALVLLLLLFILFRSRALAYGDGYSFSGYFRGGVLPPISAQLSMMTLDLVSHWAVYRTLILPLGGSALWSYSVLSAVGGIASLGAIIRLARLLAGNDLSARRLLVAAAVTSGTAALWFGYVEAYTLVNAAMLWTIALALEATRRPRLLWGAWGCWVLACAFHLLAVAAVPALVWTTWRALYPPADGRSKRVSPWVLFVIGFAGWAVATTVYRALFSPVFVPLLTTSDSAYSAFCIQHLSDVLNQLLLVAPLGIIGCVGWLLRRKQRPRTEYSPQREVLTVAAASLWYFAFWVDPLLGGFRDWDLLAAFGVPVTLWGTVLLCERRGRTERVGWRWVPVGVFALIHVGAFVAGLQNAEKAALRLDTLIGQDIHYSESFFRGTRLTPWAQIIDEELYRPDLAVGHLAVRASLAPDEAASWKNLGCAYEHMQQRDSAAACFERATALRPDEQSLYRSLGLLRFEMGDYPRARDAFQRAIVLSDTSYGDLLNLASTYQHLNEVDSVASLARHTLQRNPRRYEAYALLGSVADRRGDTAEAIRFYDSTVSHGGYDENIYERLADLYHQTGRRHEAVTVAQGWEQHFPASPKPPLFLGAMYVWLELYDSANAAFQRCLALAPGSALATYYLATTYRHLEQRDRARELAERAARLDTTLALPWLEMVYLAADAGDRAAAARATREYLRRAPADSGMEYLKQFKSP